jgi:hypothetical protein
LSCNQQRLEVRLPAYAHLDGVEVFISGQPRDDVAISRDRQLRIDLEEDTDTQEFTLEVFYWFSVVDPYVGRLSVELPEIVGADRAARAYWQLVLPRNECLLWASSNLTREISWQWFGPGWGRQASADQSKLERWLNATQQDPLPRDTNRYLFSTLGSVAPQQFVTGQLHVVLSVLSGCALAIGLLLIYFPRLRHPAVLFVGGLVLVSVGLVYPDPVVLAAQTAALGIALVLVARILEWMMARRRQRRSIVRGASYPVSDSKMREKSYRVSESSTGVTTIPVDHAASADSQS